MMPGEPLPDTDQIYLFQKGLPKELRQRLNYEQPTTLQEATALIIRMADGEPQCAQGKRAETMEIDHLTQQLSRATPTLLGLVGMCPMRRWQAPLGTVPQVNELTAFA